MCASLRAQLFGATPLWHARPLSRCQWLVLASVLQLKQAIGAATNKSMCSDEWCFVGALHRGINDVRNRVSSRCQSHMGQQRRHETPRTASALVSVNTAPSAAGLHSRCIETRGALLAGHLSPVGVT